MIAWLRPKYSVIVILCRPLGRPGPRRAIACRPPTCHYRKTEKSSAESRTRRNNRRVQKETDRNSDSTNSSGRFRLTTLNRLIVIARQISTSRLYRVINSFRYSNSST